MTPVLIPVQVGSDQWLQTRRRGVGASEIPVILGLSPWSSPFNLYWEKAGQVAPQVDNDSMAWGRELEAVILGRFARNHPELGVTTGALFHHGEDERCMATPDGIAYHRRRPTDSPTVRKHGTFKSKPHAVVQVKTDATTAEWGDEGTDQIPVYYLAQVRWEMLVMDVRTAYLPVLFSGRTYREYVVHQDDSDVELMVREASDFLDRLKYDNPPDVDWRAATTRALQQLHPDRGEGSVEIPGTWIRQWQLADRLVDAAGKRKALAENRIRALVGDRHFATVDGEPLANKVVYDQRRADLDALKRAGLYDQYTRTITINRLAIARPKKGPAK